MRYLKLLKSYDETELYDLCLKINKSTFLIEEHEIKKSYTDSHKKFEFNKRTFKSNISEIPQSLVRNLITNEASESEYINRIKLKDKGKFEFFEKKEVSIFEYELVTILKQGNVITNDSNIRNIKRFNIFK